VTDQPQGTTTYQRSEGVATITMTAPSLNRAAKVSLLEHLRTAAGDDGVRAILLTGSGRVFCAGQDLVEHAAALKIGSEHAFATIAEHYNPIIDVLTGVPKPVVAAINGSCAGAGLGVALACDVRVAAEGAKFTTAFTSIGLTPDSGLSALLPRAVGAARASELVLLAEAFPAEDALRWGLVGRVVPADELSGVAAGLAGRLAAGPTQAYASAKRAMHDAWDLPLAEVVAAEHAAQVALGATVDHRQAVDAFLAREKPTFTGR
jgi:2-(1,2-epoxy-1,2-dihydrophenyl)acetyl-CoA isomerase